MPSVATKPKVTFRVEIEWREAIDGAPLYVERFNNCPEFHIKNGMLHFVSQEGIHRYTNTKFMITEIKDVTQKNLSF